MLDSWGLGGGYYRHRCNGGTTVSRDRRLSGTAVPHVVHHYFSLRWQYRAAARWEELPDQADSPCTRSSTTSRGTRGTPCWQRPSTGSNSPTPAARPRMPLMIADVCGGGVNFIGGGKCEENVFLCVFLQDRHADKDVHRQLLNYNKTSTPKTRTTK